MIHLARYFTEPAAQKFKFDHESPSRIRLAIQRVAQRHCFGFHADFIVRAIMPSVISSGRQGANNYFHLQCMNFLSQNLNPCWEMGAYEQIFSW